MSRSIYCDGKVYRIATQLFEETRGALSTIEFTRYNFYPVRAFVITAPPGTIRGGHGHTKGRQLLMRLSGEIEVEVFYRGHKHYLRLDAIGRALLIESPVWSRQIYLGDNPAIIVFCDTPYQAEDYVWSKDETL